MSQVISEDVLPGGSHWSMRIPAGHQLQFTDIEGGANLSLLFYNPHNLLERYNAPDTLKCQHTFKLTQGHCLYSDMGRIFCSITEDQTGWIDSVAGVANKALVAKKWGARSYQNERNQWKQNGYDSLLVEVAKYGLGQRDLAANLNLFSKVFTDEQGNLQFAEQHSPAGSKITLRFEMDTLVVMSTCPHPMNPAESYPDKPIGIAFSKAAAVAADDECMNSRPENQRGFENNRIYHAHSPSCAHHH